MATVKYTDARESTEETISVVVLFYVSFFVIIILEVPMLQSNIAENIFATAPLPPPTH